MRFSWLRFLTFSALTFPWVGVASLDGSPLDRPFFPGENLLPDWSMIHGDPLIEKPDNYRSMNCDDRDRLEVFRDLGLKDPAIQLAWDKMVERSKTSAVTNCRMTYPEKNGKPIPGSRRMMLNQEYIVQEGGKFTTKTAMQGMAIGYGLLVDPESKQEYRVVLGLQVCYSFKFCRSMGIPFKGMALPKDAAALELDALEPESLVDR